jgi:hypothetical protein
MKMRRWQDVVILVLGFWLIVSPFVMQYPDLTGIAALNSYVFGFGVMVFAAIALYRPQMWEEWINLVLGIWLLVAPIVLGFRSETDAVANHLLVGLLIVIDTLSIMVPRYTRKAT